MKIINNININQFNYEPNETILAIRNSEPIEEKLHVIAVISNASNFASRYILANSFIKRLEMEEPDVILYVVEMAYGDQKHMVTDPENMRHLQLRTEIPLWHKENMINLGVEKLLPSDWKAFAWIDADLEFDSSSWVRDTLKLLNHHSDIVQLFSHCADMDQNRLSMNVFNSAGYHNSKKSTYCATGINFWHPGYAWACTRKFYNKTGGLYDKAILGSGDSIMCQSLLKRGKSAINVKSTDGYKNSIDIFEENAHVARFGYIPGLIRHNYHGSKKNRHYTDRWLILVKYLYDPMIHLKYDENGILVPTLLCPKELLKDISNYFNDRHEDDGLVLVSSEANLELNDIYVY